MKEHDQWVQQKKKIDGFEEKVLFQEREIWWCATGVNIGHEQDGRGEKFRRPVLVIKKFNNSLCWVLPFTTSLKENIYQLHVMALDTPNQVILSQLKVIDGKRLIKKVGMLSSFQFDEIKKALINLLSSGELFVV